MLAKARLAPPLLGDNIGAVHDFLWTQLNPDGGFKSQSGPSDLYDTVFGIEALLALGAEVPLTSLARFILPLGDGGQLDFVHLACLARAWSLLPADKFAPELRENITERILIHRTLDGGFSAAPHIPRQSGTVYGCYLALQALGDLGVILPGHLWNAGALTTFIENLILPAGGFANEQSLPLATTATTASAVAILHETQGSGGEEEVGWDTQAIADSSRKWLWARIHPNGGLRATPQAPMPDLISTAVGLHALWLLDPNRATRPLAWPPAFRERTLDFLDSLWSNQGAFHGNWTADAPSCEHVYYALLALGHLADT